MVGLRGRPPCVNNLKQIGFAAQNHHDINGCFPGGSYSALGNPNNPPYWCTYPEVFFCFVRMMS